MIIWYDCRRGVTPAVFRAMDRPLDVGVASPEAWVLKSSPVPDVDDEGAAGCDIPVGRGPYDGGGGAVGPSEKRMPHFGHATTDPGGTLIASKV